MFTQLIRYAGAHSISSFRFAEGMNAFFTCVYVRVSVWLPYRTLTARTMHHVNSEAFPLSSPSPVTTNIYKNNIMMNNESGILDTSTKYSSFAPFTTPSTDSDAPNKYKMLRKKNEEKKRKEFYSIVSNIQIIHIHVLPVLFVKV